MLVDRRQLRASGSHCNAPVPAVPFDRRPAPGLARGLIVALAIGLAAGGAPQPAGAQANTRAERGGVHGQRHRGRRDREPTRSARARRRSARASRPGSTGCCAGWSPAEDSARLPPAASLPIDDYVQSFEIANEELSSTRYIARAHGAPTTRTRCATCCSDGGFAFAQTAVDAGGRAAAVRDRAGRAPVAGRQSVVAGLGRAHGPRAAAAPGAAAGRSRGHGRWCRSAQAQAARSGGAGRSRRALRRRGHAGGDRPDRGRPRARAGERGRGCEATRIGACAAGRASR